MGGGEKKKANQMADEQYKRENASADQFAAQNAQTRATGQAHGEDLYGSLRQGYGNLTSPDFMQSIMPAGGWGSYSAANYSPVAQYGQAQKGYEDFSKTGGVDIDRLRSIQPEYQKFIQNGGIDPSQQASINETVGMFKNMGRTGGVSEANQNRMRGGGGYEEFAKTGGFSGDDISNIRRRGVSPIAASYQRANTEADRMRSVQGGYGPGAQAMKDRLLRNTNADAASAALNTELGIKDQVNQGRQFGIGGMAQSEGNLQSLLTGNMLQGMQGAGQLDMSLADALQRGRMFGVSGLDQNEMSAQGMQQQGRMFGTSGMRDIAGDLQSISNANAAAGAGAANANVGQQMDLARLGLSSRMAGLEGLSSLYGSGPSGETQYADQMDLANRGQRSDTSLNVANNKMANNMSGWDRATQIASAAAGIAAPIMTGGLSSLAGAGIQAARGRPSGAGSPAFSVPGIAARRPTYDLSMYGLGG